MFKELKLDSHINTHLIQANRNLSFLFFNDPNSALNTGLNKDVKDRIVKIAGEFDMQGLNP